MNWDFVTAEQRVVDVAVEIHRFAKTHELPKQDSEEFFEFTQLLDKLETALRDGKII